MCKSLSVFHCSHFPFLFSTVLELFDVQDYRNFEIWVRGRSGSLKMEPFNRSFTTSYLSAGVSIAVFCTVFLSSVSMLMHDVSMLMHDISMLMQDIDIAVLSIALRYSMETA